LNSEKEVLEALKCRLIERIDFDFAQFLQENALCRLIIQRLKVPANEIQN
jgi:hypothetical protein